MIDPISDMIIRIKNALAAGHSEVVLPGSKIKAKIAEILVENGYLVDSKLEPTKPQATLKLTLKYVGKMPAVSGVKRLSKPGRRLYASSDRIPRALGGFGLTIISSSKGIMSDKQARKQNVGGELLFQIW